MTEKDFGLIRCNTTHIKPSSILSFPFSQKHFTMWKRQYPSKGERLTLIKKNKTKK